jgi:TRAP-type C4-dicarboxylate transport system permease large subunit
MKFGHNKQRYHMVRKFNNLLSGIVFIVISIAVQTLINIILLILGCFMSTIPVLVLAVPIVVPLSAELEQVMIDSCPRHSKLKFWYPQLE